MVLHMSRYGSTHVIVWFYTPVMVWFYTQITVWFYTPAMVCFYTPSMLWFYSPMMVCFYSLVMACSTHQSEYGSICQSWYGSYKKYSIWPTDTSPLNKHYTNALDIAHTSQVFLVVFDTQKVKRMFSGILINRYVLLPCCVFSTL